MKTSLFLLVSLVALPCGDANTPGPSTSKVTGCEPENWQLSASREWLVFTCAPSGGGLVDSFATAAVVFLYRLDGSSAPTRSVEARDHSLSLAEDVLWYIDDDALIARMALASVQEEVAAGNLSDVATLSSTLGAPISIVGLDSSSAIVEVEKDDGRCEICLIGEDRARLRILECRPSSSGQCTFGGVAVTASEFVLEVASPSAESGYAFEYWTTVPLQKKWSIDLPVEIEPRGVLPGINGEILVVGCSGPPPAGQLASNPYVAILDRSGVLRDISIEGETCGFGPLNPCPAVVGGYWDDGKWRVWLERALSPNEADCLIVSHSLTTFCESEQSYPDWIGQLARPQCHSD